MKRLLLLFLVCIMFFAGCNSESEKYMKLADEYFADGQYDYAAYNYVRVLETDRENKKAYMNLIDSYIAQEKLYKASEYLEKAEEKFGIQSAEDKRKTLEELIEKEKSKPTPTAVPAPEDTASLLEESVNSEEISTNLEYLKSYIQSNGNTNEDGDKLIELSDSGYTVAIVYNAENDVFKFGILCSYSDIDMAITYLWNAGMGDSTIVDAYLSSSINGCCATAILDISNYQGQDLEYEIYDIGGFYTEGLEENVSTVLNSVFESGMKGFDLLLSKMEMELSDIGFTSYKK